MNMKTIIICFALLVLASCTTAQEQKITTDLVQSPLTAENATNQSPHFDLIIYILRKH